ncbi:MAG: hypothetical protein ACOYWZ_10420 [Bacillota bacterium]
MSCRKILISLLLIMVVFTMLSANIPVLAASEAVGIRSGAEYYIKNTYTSSHSTLKAATHIRSIIDVNHLFDSVL